MKNGKWGQIPYYAKSEEEARRILTELKHRQDRQEPIHFDRQSVGGWLETWLDTFIRPHRKPRTFTDYHKIIHKYVLPAIAVSIDWKRSFARGSHRQRGLALSAI